MTPTVELDMDLLLLFGIGGAIVIALVVVAARGLSPRVAEDRASRTPRLVGIDLPDAIRPLVIRRQRRDVLGGVAGALVGTAIAIALAMALPDTGTVRLLVLIGGCWVGLAIGTAVANATWRPAIPDAAPRIARARATTIADYATPARIIGARAVAIAGIGVAAVLGIGVAPRDLGAAVLPAISVLTTTLALATFEIGARRIVAAPQRAEGSAALAWDDALRAQAIGQMALAPIYCGMYAAWLPAAGVTAAAGGSGLALVASVSTVGLSLIAVGALVATLVGDPERHYLRRLWPELARNGSPDAAPETATRTEAAR